MWRYIILFCVVTCAGLVLLQLQSLQPAIELFCLLLAQISWQVIHLFDDSITLTAAIMRYGATGFALEVTDECSALPITWLYISAVLTFPFLTVWQRAYGLLLGVLLLQGLNVLRIISLLYIGIWLPREQFDLIHEYFWPLLLHLFAFVLFIYLLAKHLPASTAHAQP